MKNLSTLAEVSHWYWEISSIQHTAEIFELRLDSLATAPLAVKRKESVQSMLGQLHDHRKELIDIQLAMEEYNLLSVTPEKERNGKLFQLEEVLRKKVQSEIDSFTQVKNQYFCLIQDMLLA
jgi:hypothetical protein